MAAAGGYLRDAAGNFTTFIVPGLASTIVTGINNAGTVVGYNTFGFGPGFLRDAAGNITTFQIPGLTPGFLIGVFSPVINDAGIVAGNYSSQSDGPPHGFLRDAAGNITTFDAPGSSTTSVTAINNAGTVLGTSNSPSFPNYLRDAAGNFSTFSVPGSDSTFFDAINNAGTVAGTFVAGGLAHGFLRDAAGNFTTFDIPGATPSVLRPSMTSGWSPGPLRRRAADNRASSATPPAMSRPSTPCRAVLVDHCIAQQRRGPGRDRFRRVVSVSGSSGRRLPGGPDPDAGHGRAEPVASPGSR